MPTKYSREEMNELADLLMDESIEGTLKEFENDPYWDKMYASWAEGTGYTGAQFRAICDYRWNGPNWCR